jgi:uncharacterized membrane protein
VGKLIDYVGSMIIRGVVVLLPLAIVAFILAEAVSILADAVEPLADLIPVQVVFGMDMTYWVALAILLFACFALGFLTQTDIGSAINAWLERTIFDRLPGYRLARSLTQGVSGSDTKQSFPVALVRLQERGAEAMALVVERNTDDSYTVFVPLAPTPTLGSVYVVPHERVRMLDIPATSMLNCVMQWGIGTRDAIALSQGSTPETPASPGRT